MTRLFLVLLSAGFLLDSLPMETAQAGIRTVAVKPTPQNVEPGKAVLYDDGKCPAGQIGKFRKAKNKESISKTCVHLSNPGQ